MTRLEDLLILVHLLLQRVSRRHKVGLTEGLQCCEGWKEGKRCLVALLKVPSLSRVNCVCNWTTSALGGRKMQPGSVHVQTFYLQTDKLIRRHGHHLKRFPLKLDWKSIKCVWKPPKVIHFPLVECLWDPTRLQTALEWGELAGCPL